MPKKRKKKKASKLKAQAEAHRALYGDSSREVLEYGRQSEETQEKYNVFLNGNYVDKETLKIFRRKVEQYAQGKEMRSELLFYRILKILNEGESLEINEEVKTNLVLLERSGFIDESKITPQGRELLRRIEQNR